MTTTSRAAAVWLGLVLPVLLIVVILGADVIESPKTAYVGVLAVVPMLAAVFAPPPMTAVVAVITWLSAFGFGQLASDGNVAAQQVRLVIIALAGLAAVGAALLVYARHATDGERIRLQGPNLVVELENAGRLERAEFHRDWVRVEPRTDQRSLIEVSGRGRSVQVGRFVRPELRPALAQEIRRALREA